MLLESAYLALSAIVRNALRSALTLLGVTIGVAAVIAMLTLGGGTALQVSDSISSLGSNLLIVRPGQVTQGPAGIGAASFRLADADAIERRIVGITAAAPVNAIAMTAVAGSSNHMTTVQGVDSRFFDVRHWAITEGRSYRQGELAAGSASCILGSRAADALFGAGVDPLDRTLRLKSMVCTVIGLLETKGGGSFGADQDDVVLIPLRTYQRRIAGNDDVSVIYVSVSDEKLIVRVQQQITSLLRERRHLAANEDDDFMVMEMRQISSLLDTITGVLTGLLAAVAGISLLVGGIGIMNMMLVSVTERTREIGIRLAIGAQESQVLAQFLVEAIILSMIGGLAGILLGLALSAGAVHLIGVPFVWEWWGIALAFFCSAVIGIVFGYFPARNAAHLNPIEALRHE